MSHKTDGSVTVAPFKHAFKHRSVTIDENDPPSEVAAKLATAFGDEYVKILGVALKRFAKVRRMRGMLKNA